MHEYLVSIREEEQAQKGPAAQAQKFDWNAQSARYRCLYVEEGQQAVGEISEGQDPEVWKKHSRGYSEADLQKALDEGGKLSISQMLRCRMRFTCDGMYFGMKGFVEAGHELMKEALPEAYANRKNGAKKMSFTKDKRIFAHRRHVKDACRAS